MNYANTCKGLASFQKKEYQQKLIWFDLILLKHKKIPAHYNLLSSQPLLVKQERILVSSQNGSFNLGDQRYHSLTADFCFMQMQVSEPQQLL